MTKLKSTCGYEFTLNKQIAKSENCSLFISKIAKGYWSFLAIDHTSNIANQVGEVYATKGHILLDANRYAKSYGFNLSEMI